MSRKVSKTIVAIQQDLVAREKKGIETYGTTVDQAGLTREEWMQHLYEELLDAVIYLKKLQTTSTPPTQTMRLDFLDFSKETVPDE